MSRYHCNIATVRSKDYGFQMIELDGLARTDIIVSRFALSVFSGLLPTTDLLNPSLA